jgi:DNA-directed RNA polymerase subunit RPC12/RpoP
MSEVRTFFRFCPNCGKRFHIKLVDKELVKDEVETESIPEKRLPRGSLLGVGFADSGIPGTMIPGATVPGVPIEVEENVPMVMDVKDFQYTYKCLHCGHQWTEAKEQVTKG